MPNDRDNPTFALLNAFVDGGWPGRLTAVQLAVWLVHLRHANGSLIAWPGIPRMARAIGHAGTAHVRRARADLKRLGLLRGLSEKGPNGEAKFLMCIPSSPSVTPLVTGAGAELEQGPKPCRPETGARSEPAEALLGIGAKPCSESAHIRSEEGHKEGHKEALPAELDTDAFRRAWDEWTAYRKETRHKLTPSTVKIQLRDLAAMGEQQAIASIRRSIGNGWRGLFLPKGGEQQGGRSTTSRFTKPGEYPEPNLYAGAKL